MRAVVQRSKKATVHVGEELVGAIDAGLVILLAVAPQDTEKQVVWLAEKIAHLRIFPDEAGKMNLSLLDVGLEALVVSQFTLYGDCRKGRRPNFTRSAHPDIAKPLYEYFCRHLASLSVPVETGRFAAMMDVQLCNDGPVTLIVDSPER
ncbi:MAG: D-tyrosyl-tRNA(Tyr) deacylase [Proteobacteria bacterium]|nr:D-tyrosyl-tRNA(Tyr) deacylase [Pseudomonadota bacterium]